MLPPPGSHSHAIQQNSADVVVKPPETSIGSEPAVPVRVLGSIAEHTIPSSAASTDAWRDVDLARWAAVNRGTACPSPVPVAPGALPSRRVHPQASTATSKPVPAQQSVTGRLLDPHADGGEEVVRALAAQKFSMLEDKEALRERAAAGGDAGGAPVSVGECLDTRCLLMLTSARSMIRERACVGVGLTCPPKNRNERFGG